LSVKIKEKTLNITDFMRHGIPVDKPGFYNHPMFLELEKTYPPLLNDYNRFVFSKNYSETYLSQVRKKIVLISNTLFEELVRDGRKGACIDICQAFGKNTRA
jgi:hypothetical protein